MLFRSFVSVSLSSVFALSCLFIPSRFVSLIHFTTHRYRHTHTHRYSSTFQQISNYLRFVLQVVKISNIMLNNHNNNNNNNNNNNAWKCNEKRFTL